MEEQNEAGRLLRDAYRNQMAGRLDEAVELYKQSIKAQPTAEAHTFLGWTYSFQRRYAEAIRHCHQAIEIDPEFGNPYNDIGVYLIELGRLDEAIPWLERAKTAARYDPRHFPCINLARIYFEQLRYEEAIAELEKALRIVPGHEPAEQLMTNIISKMN